jgi:hypothetical protein
VESTSATTVAIRCAATEETVSVTGSVAGELVAPLEVTVTFAWYVPGFRPGAVTCTEKLPGVALADGLTESHG